MNAATKLGITALAVVALITAATWPSPKAEAEPTYQEAPRIKAASDQDQIAAAIDRQTAATNRLLLRMAGELSDMQARLTALEQPAATEPTTTNGSTGTSTDTASACVGGSCAVSYSAPVQRTYVRTYTAPRRAGLFRGRLRGGLRAIGRRIGYRIVRPFGGRFRR